MNNQDELSESKKRQLEAKYGTEPAEDEPKDAAVPERSDPAAAAEAEVEDVEALDREPEHVDNPDHDEKPEKQPGKFKRFFAAYWHKKAWTLPVTLLFAVLIAAAVVPWSRYLILGQYISRPYQVTVVDAKTSKPVSSVTVSVGGIQAETDAKGMATIKAKVGSAKLEAGKRYYKTFTKDVFVGIDKQKGADQIQLTATGRQVPVVITDKITGKPMADAVLEAVGTEVKTAKDGKASIVLPADKATLNGSITAKGYNTQKVVIHVVESESKDNSFAMVPNGKVYFLSRLSGKIDVVKTDLDGANRETVVAGTGREEEGGTVLLASRDWKYLAFLSKRDSDLPKLYLIDTATDKMTVLDEGDAEFQLAGWSEHTFAFTVQRKNVNVTQPNSQAVKTFDAEKKQLLTIDQNEAEAVAGGVIRQTFGNFALVQGKLLYTVVWNYNYTGGYYAYATAYAGKTSTIRQVTVGTTNKKDLKSFDSTTTYFGRIAVYAPQEVYYSTYDNTAQKDAFYEYEDGEIKDMSQAEIDTFKSNAAYPTYLTSPSADKTFWADQRDGKATFFTGDASAHNAKQVAVIDDGQVYGWYSDNYLLVSKKGSELYIMPVDGGTPLKVTDYHKPTISYYGYGGGYGGL